MASAVSSELDLHLVFGKIHGQVKRVIDAPLFFVALRSGESDAITLEYLVEGEHIFPPAEHHMEGTIVGRVITSGKAVLVGNMRERDLLTGLDAADQKRLAGLLRDLVAPFESDS